MCTKYFYLMIIVVTVSSCFKDESTTTTTIIKNDPRYIVSQSELVIEVADENEEKIVGLTASFNDEIKVVDKASFFHFEGKNVNRFEELLQITDQNGYVYDYLIQSQANEVNYKKINVFINKLTDRFGSTEDYKLQLSPEVSVLLIKNNFLVNINQNFTGNIDIRHNHYDINNESHVRSLPGGKFGVKDNQLWLLDIEEAFEFNLYSADKQKLALKNQVEMQINAVKGGSALYHYDANSHVWTYQQDVSSNEKVLISRTGTYCIAQSRKYTILNGQWIINQVPAKQSNISLQIGSHLEQVITSNNGKWEAVVPLGENIQIIYKSDCSVSENQQVMTDKTNYDAGVHNTSTNKIVAYQFAGQMKDCDGNFIKEGFLKIRTQNGDKTIYVDTSQFSVTLPLCDGDEVSVSCASVSSEYETILLNEVPQIIDLSTLFLCTDIKDDYFVLNIDGHFRKYTDFTKTISDQFIQLGNTGFNDPIFLKFDHQNGPGKIENNRANIVWNDNLIGGFGVLLNCPSSNNCGFTNVEITYWNQITSVIRGKFTGRFWLKTINPVGATYKDISGEFQIKM